MRQPEIAEGLEPPAWEPDLARYHGAEEERGTRSFGRRVSLQYGGHTLRYESASDAVSLEVTGPRLAFVVGDDAPAAATIVCDVGEVECDPSPVLFQGGNAWGARRLDDGRQEICFGLDRSIAPRPWCRLRHDEGLSSLQFRIGPRERPDAISVGFPTDEYIMARRLARSGGIVIHAASLVQDGLAYLFVGHSGAGKSTTAMHAVSAGAEVLSDDRTIVTVAADGTARAWGTPWHGSFRRATNASAPIGGLFVVIQDATERVTPITPVRAIGEAFVRLIHPTPDTNEVAMTVETLERLVSAVPVAELRQRAGPAGYLEARRFVDAQHR